MTHAQRADGQTVPEAIADLGTGRRLCYADLWDGAARVAGGLLAAGVRPGDRVAIRLPNGADWGTASW